MEKDIISKNNELTIFSTKETEHLTNWKTFCQEFIHLDSLLLEANPYMFQPSNIDIEYSQPSVDKLSSQEMIYPVEKKSKQRLTNPIKWNTNLTQTYKSTNTETTIQQYIRRNIEEQEQYNITGQIQKMTKP